MLISTKIQRSDILSLKSTGVYLHKHINAACCVCHRFDVPTKTVFTSAFYYEELYFVNNVYYIIPKYPEHDTCRELFKLNPLVYE